MARIEILCCLYQMKFLRLLLSCLLLVVAEAQYNATYTGDLTYYGLQSPPGAGHCSSQFSGSSTQPWTTGVKAFMALNHPQYGDSSWCGLCIAYRALGPGSGATEPPTTFTYAQISDECPEVLMLVLCLSAPCFSSDVPPATHQPRGLSCNLWSSIQLSRLRRSRLDRSCTCRVSSLPITCLVAPQCKSGDLDIGLDGDGRWQGEWHGVACDTGGTGFYYSTQGSNNYYLKLQVSNTALTVSGVQMMVGGSYAQLTRTVDNYWQLYSASPIAIPAAVKITSSLGEVVEDSFSPSSLSGPPSQGTGQFSIPEGMEVVGGATATPVGTSGPASPQVVTPTPLPTALSSTLVPVPASTESGNCTVPVSPYGQCGGMGGDCVNLGGCQNAPLAGLCCSDGFQCTEINKWFYYCSRNSTSGAESASALITIPDYSQCGGSDVWGTTLDVVASDGVWNGTQCSTGFQCVRFDQYTWQCRDTPSVIPPALNAPVSSLNNGSAAESGNSQVSLTQASCYA